MVLMYLCVFLFQGAGLDVTVPEPLPTDHPLLSLKNCGKILKFLYSLSLLVLLSNSKIPQIVAIGPSTNFLESSSYLILTRTSSSIFG